MGVKFALTCRRTNSKQRLKVFKNRMLKHIWAKGGGSNRAVEELHNEELHDLYCSPNKVRVIKSRRMSRTGHVAYMGREEVHTIFWWANLREGGQLEDLHTDGR